MKSFYRKVYVILCLSGAVTIGLLYLILSGKTETLAALGPNGTGVTPTPTVQTTSTPESSSPSETAIPSPSSTPESTTDSETYDTTSNDSLYRIVNKTNTIESTYVPNDLVEVNVARKKTILLRSEAASKLEEMFSAASQSGIELYVVSGYRDYDWQTTLQNYYIDTLGKQEADRIDCIPGGSEHQLGLAVDLGETSKNCELQGCFAYTSTYSWLKENAHLYGFVERYPEGKEEITGIKYSPWNFRYVGTDLATKVYESGLCLEEYFN